METWEDCRNYGLTEIVGSDIRIYFNQCYYKTVGTPLPGMVIESAIWQGNSLIVRGLNGNHPIGYVFRSPDDHQQIF